MREAESDAAERVRHNLRQVLPSRLAGIQWVLGGRAGIFNCQEANLQVLRSDIDTPQPTHHLTDLRFADLPLSAGLLQGISEAGFTQCTPIQSKTLPLALDGQDVAGQAQTGTGKTAAFLLALFHRLEHNPPLVTEPGPPAPRALIMAPTRELAVQVHADALALGKHLPFKLGLAFGGTDYDKQREVLAAGVDVLIGTPGRLIDFYKQRVFGLRGIQVLVLDEADRMFDLGFIKDIRYVLRRLPEHHRRLNMLFSATLSHRVLELAYEHMNDPELVRIDRKSTRLNSSHSQISYAVFCLNKKTKSDKLLTHL